MNSAHEPSKRRQLGKWTWKDVALPDDVAEELAVKFEAGCLEANLVPVRATQPSEVHPRQVELLSYLGELYSRMGQVHKGLEVDEELVRLRPDEPIFYYNLACSHSQLGQIESGFEALERAIRLGYQRFDHVRADSDLDNLKKHERFHKLIARYEQQS